MSGIIFRSFKIKIEFTQAQNPYRTAQVSHQTFYEPIYSFMATLKWQFNTINFQRRVLLFPTIEASSVSVLYCESNFELFDKYILLPTRSLSDRYPDKFLEWFFEGFSLILNYQKNINKKHSSAINELKTNKIDVTLEITICLLYIQPQ